MNAAPATTSISTSGSKGAAKEKTMFAHAKKTLTQLALTVGLGSVATPALAWDPAPAPRFDRPMPRFDDDFGRGTDRGRRRWRPVDRLDRNGDGVVSRFELRAHHRMQAELLVDRVDVDDDGWLSPRELRRAARDGIGFSLADLDRDGALTRPEAQLARRGMREGLPVARLVSVKVREADRAFEEHDFNRDGMLDCYELGPEYGLLDEDVLRPPRRF